MSIVSLSTGPRNRIQGSEGQGGGPPVGHVDTSLLPSSPLYYWLSLFWSIQGQKRRAELQLSRSSWEIKHTQKWGLKFQRPHIPLTTDNEKRVCAVPPINSDKCIRIPTDILLEVGLTGRLWPLSPYDTFRLARRTQAAVPPEGHPRPWLVCQRLSPSHQLQLWCPCPPAGSENSQRM